MFAAARLARRAPSPCQLPPVLPPRLPPFHCRGALKRDQGRGRRDANGGSSTTKTGLRQGWLPVSVRRRLRVSCWRDSPCVAAAITPYHSSVVNALTGSQSAELKEAQL